MLDGPRTYHDLLSPLLAGRDLATAWKPLREATHVNVSGDRVVSRGFDVAFGMRFSGPSAYEVRIGGRSVCRGRADAGEFRWALFDRSPLLVLPLAYHEIEIRVDDLDAVDLLIGTAQTDLRLEMFRNAWISAPVGASDGVEIDDDSRRRLAFCAGLGNLVPEDHDFAACLQMEDVGKLPFVDGIKLMPDMPALARGRSDGPGCA